MPTELFLPPEPGSNNPQVVSTPEGIKLRWSEHFYKLLNQLAEVNKDKLAEFVPKQQAELTDLAHKAPHPELCNALNFMGCDKAPGIDGRPVEVEKYAVTSQIVVAICAAFNKALEDKDVPALWRDVIITILFKKGIEEIATTTGALA
jgi:hypothetical protein